MKKRIFLFAGMATLFVVGIIGFIGCEVEPTKYDYEYFFYNRSSYAIQVTIDDGYDIYPKSFTIRSGAEKKCEGNTRYTTTNPFYFHWNRADGNGIIGVRWDLSTSTFYNQ
jgi:hypothetical protein